MKHHSLSKVLKRLACVLAALVIALAVAVFALWHNELATLSSLKKLSDRDEAHRDGAVYQLNVSGGYYFDDFLAQGGASTDSALISFITQSITKGIIPMNIKTSTIACSAFTADTQSGDRVFGRNYDFSATNTAIVYTNPGKGRHASYSTIDLSFLGLDKDKDVESLGQKILTLAAPYVPLDGVNDAGVACGIFMSYQGEGKGTPHRHPDRQARPHLHHPAPAHPRLRRLGGGRRGAGPAVRPPRLGKQLLPLHGGRLHRPQRHPRVGGC